MNETGNLQKIHENCTICNLASNISEAMLDRVLTESVIY